MKKIIVIGLLVFLGKSNFSSANTITQEMVDSLNYISYDLGSSYPDSAFLVASKSCRFAKKLNYVNGEITALLRMGRAIFKQNQLDSSLYYFNKSERLFSNKGSDSVFLAKTFVYQGLVYRKLGKLSLASKKYHAGYLIAKSKRDEILMGSCLLNLSNIFIAQGEYKNALTVLNDALHNFSKENHSELAGVHLNMGNIFELESRENEAFISYKSALHHYDKIDDSFGISKSLMSLGNVYLNTNQSDSALFYYEQAYSIASSHKFNGIISKIGQNKGEYFFNRNQIDSAFHYFSMSIEANEKNQSVADLSLAHERLGDIYVSKKAFSKGLNSYISGYISSVGLSDHSQLKSLTYKISMTHSALGNSDSAFLYMGYSKNYQDTISQRLNDALIYEINLNKEKHKVNTLQLKLEQQSSDLKKQKTISWLSIGIGIIAIMLLFWVVKYYKQRKKNIDKQKRIDDLLNKQGEEAMNAMLDGQETEKNRIASELHDRLGSILSTVKLYFKSMDKEIDKLKAENIEQFEIANDLLDEACEEVRKIAHDLSTGVLKDQGLFRAVKNLIDKIEGSGEVHIQLITYGTDDDLLIVNQSAIYRIIQESLSNTLKHADAKKISIQLNIFDDLFNLIIEDDGIGFDANQLVNNSGMGLRSNKARVSKMNGTFNIDSGKGIGTTINIDIPLDNQV